MKTKYLWFIVILILFSSCKKEEELTLSASNYLIFGSYYGMCATHNCVDIFRLEEGQLLKETSRAYPTGMNFYQGKYIKMSQQQFDDVKDLISFFPNDLLSEPDTIIGMPDAGDWGGLYVEYNYNGVRKFWILDQMKPNVPPKYHPFIEEVNKKINLLK